jgi:FtsP/CotA-like multicopper oxidase with cupredoxin domain
MKRREFLKLSAAGVATLFIGRIPGFGIKDAFAATQVLEVSITDALKDMVTHNEVNTAQSYFWIYKMKADGIDVPADCPGPTIVALKGESIAITVTNDLDEPHAFYIPGRLPSDPPMFDSGEIKTGESFTGTFTASQSGAFLYYDNLNAPVNRVMGLHGALVIRPTAAVAGHKMTPYDAPSPHVQDLYDAFGDPNIFPGLAWEQGDPQTHTPPFRQYVWLTHQVSPTLFAEVGSLPPGQLYDPQKFQDAFLRDPFSATGANRLPKFFTINGQSGFFSHFSPGITPMGRVGEPVVIHILSAGLWTHSMHIHANHVYITSEDGVPKENPIWVDVYTVKPMQRVDYTVPYMRPPDIPNLRGMGRPDPGMPLGNGNRAYPPQQEFDMYLPRPGEDIAQDVNGNPVDLKQRMSPLCFPMHDHSEPSQTAQGGNYNNGLISGIYFTGDRNTPGAMNFPMDEDFAMMYRNIRGIAATGPAPGPTP